MQVSLPSYFSSGEGPAVILLHSTLSSKNQWRSLSTLLETDYRVIAVDLYGYGDTPAPTVVDDFTLLDEAKLVESLLDELLLPDEPFHLVGHSYGGAVALRLCHHAPSRVSTLTLFEPVAFHLLSPSDPALSRVFTLRQELGRMIEAGLREEAVETFIDYWGGPGTFAKFPPRVQKDFEARADKLLLDFIALTHTNLTLKEYRTLKLPVTLIAGKSSKGPALRVAEALAQTLPQCRMVWVETGHMGPVTDPDVVNPVIRESLFTALGEK
ncbi:alpha/beta hydrolase [Geomonas sp.]|uniref:alpha/beta fold hydrolase n=1 Tax=Geomonas sp. TaxID=2651584 RepID=UPI002B46CADE|nr:alpha/beta hydrolase [Geomonas sp.]HJV33697.1 alpha/beta hydrolase [Geomonas sp.]